MASLADDIAALRGRGINDNDILSKYREFDPQHNADFDKLIGEGVTATQILDKLGPFKAQQEAYESADPQASEGILEKSAKALQYGGATAATGLGRTADWIGRASGLEAARRAGVMLEDAGKAITPANYRPAYAQFMDPSAKDKGMGGFGWEYLPRALLEGAPGLAMDLGVGALTGGTGFLASNAARGFGPTMDARTQNNGGKDATATDYAAALGSTALQAYLSKVGVSPAASSVAKGAGLAAVAQIPGQVAKAAAVDAASGVAGNVVQQAGDSIGTDKGLSINPHEALGAGVTSGATAGALRAARGAGDINNSIKFRDIDPEAGGRLAQRIKDTGLGIDSPETSYYAFKVMDSQLKSSTDRLKEHVLNDASPEVHELVGRYDSILDNGRYVRPEEFTALRDRLVSTKFGDKFADTLAERNALNMVKDNSRLDAENKTLTGGIASSPFFRDVVSPMSWLRSPFQRTLGGAGVAGALLGGLSPAAHAFAVGTAPKIVAAQGAAMAGARAIDALAASRNPLREFTNRFDGVGGAKASEKAVSDPDRASRAGLLAVEEALGSKTPVALPKKGTAAEPADASGVPDRAREASLSALEQAFRTDEPRAGAGRSLGASGKAQEGDAGPSQGMGSAEPLTGASEAPKGSAASVDSDAIDVRSGKYSVSRPRESIHNVKSYVTKTKDHLNTRANFGSELEAVAQEHVRDIEGLINKINKQARSADEANSFIEDTITSLPWDKQSAAWDVFLKHEPKLSATFRRQK